MTRDIIKGGKKTENIRLHQFYVLKVYLQLLVAYDMKHGITCEKIRKY